MSTWVLYIVTLLLGSGSTLRAQNDFKEIVITFTANVTKARHVVIFGCDKRDLLETTKSLLFSDIFVNPIKIMRNSSNFKLEEVLSRHIHARTSVVVDCKCNGTIELLEKSSDMVFFNKTYQWLLWDASNIGVLNLLPPKLKYPGLNSQVTYVNRSDIQYIFWDVYSKGRHLGGSLELNVLATFNRSEGFTLFEDINALQGIKFRSQFNGFQLRGASVIDKDNITTNEQIETLLSSPKKEAGIATFVKYHYDMMSLVRDFFNFTVNFRNARGWAGRMRNSSFRLGFLGIMQRDEADVGVSPAFNRLNRFAEFDTIHLSWKFETGFLYRFTPDLDTHGKSGNFLAPFHGLVWIVAMCSVCVVNFVWHFIERIKALKRNMDNENQLTELNKRRRYEEDDSETSWSGLSLKTFAAVCQQGMDPIPNGLPSRLIVFTVFLFSLVMYNYYTSSVVGGLLSSTGQGPENIEDIVASPLKLSFEDIGYYKILFRERQNRSLTVQRLYNLKVLPERSSRDDMPLYMQIEDAIPYLKKGGYAIHSEVIDAYPEIARRFDAGEICDLRMVSGLLETEMFPWVIVKRSQYTEIFRIFMLRASEAGLVDRHLQLRRPPKPPCQALYRVFPIAISGVSSAFLILAAAHIVSLLVLLMERKVYKMKKQSVVQA